MSARAPAVERARADAPPASRGVARDAARALLAALVLGTLGGGLAALVEFEDRPLTLDGVPVPAGDPEPFVRRLAAQWHDTEVTIDAGPRVVRATRREMGGRLDVDRTLEELRLARGDGPIWSRVWALVTRRDGDLAWHREVDAAEARALAEELRERVSIDPRPLRRDGTGGRPGASIALLGATSALADAVRTDAVYVRLPVRRHAPPNATPRDPRHARFDQVVAAHETRYARYGDAAGRARNIELAASFLDGIVIEPRGELSFNEEVGPRTFERGFAPATELAGGRRVEGIGGGICQVAATLHAAAFFGGFDILEHHPHTRNSRYIPAGLDSAVSWPNADLVVRNPHDFHVRVRATAYRGVMRIELMGARRAPRVEWNTHVVHRIPRQTEREVVPTMSPGVEEVVDEGEDGSVLERTRTVFWSDGAVTETTRLRYPVVHRLVRAGPGGAAGDDDAAGEAP
ncbi:MAG TPA: VanW family protein [Sandaracinaceae bacterium LLY-WYZ-13_1]|nr:VanW family protein [Sandaracinaceae bacterium LLY-WYZ-13_1]